MEKIITIKPLDITEVRVNKASPITNRRSKISKEKVNQFDKFKDVKKGAIDEQELLLIKPGLDVNNLSEYEENLSVEKLISKIMKINKVLRKYGYVNLCISPDNIKKLMNTNNVSEPKVQEESKLITTEDTQLLEADVPKLLETEEIKSLSDPQDHYLEKYDNNISDELLSFDENENFEDERKLIA